MLLYKLCSYPQNTNAINSKDTKNNQLHTHTSYTFELKQIMHTHTHTHTNI